MKNATFKQWMDFTVSVEIEKGKFLRKATPSAPKKRKMHRCDLIERIPDEEARALHPDLYI